MKRKILFMALALLVVITVNGQFVPKNIAFQDPAYLHYPQYISIADASNVWLGTSKYTAGKTYGYSTAVHTTDGGGTWKYSVIPMTGQPMISSLFAVDANTCYYVFTDNGKGGAIWKTSDGGTTWTDKTSTLFSIRGAFADFYCGFDTDNGIAVGDPTDGYFEIQRTTNGGDTWTRIAESSIPAILENEMGANDAFSAFGDNIWFASAIPDENGTYSTRCFKSADQGRNWTVSPIIASQLTWVDIDFSTPMKGVIWDLGAPGGKKEFYRTSDGGSTWVTDSISVKHEVYFGMCAVSGFEGGYVYATNDTAGYSTTVYFTPDFFETRVVIGTNLEAIPWGIKFKDASLGWLQGIGSDSSAVFKFSGLLTSARNAVMEPEKLAIMPNPTSAEALIKLPGMNDKNDLILKVYDNAGTLLETRKVASATGWAKLDASTYSNGVYVLQVVSGTRLVSSARWVVQH